MEKVVFNVEDKMWDTVVQLFHHDFYHLRAYNALEAQRLGGWAHAIYVVHQNSRLFLPFIVRPLPEELDLAVQNWHDATSAYGYPGLLFACNSVMSESAEVNKQLLEAVLEILRDMNVIDLFVRLHPLLSKRLVDLRALGLLAYHGETVWLDMNATSEELYRQIRSTTRNEINRMARDGYVARLSQEPCDLAIFSQIYEDTMNRLGAAKEYFFGDEYFLGLANALGEKLQICLVEKEDTVCCAGLFPVTCGIVQYHFSGTLTAFAHQPVTKLMLYHVANWAKAQNCTAMHLGGGLGATADSLFKFKTGFSKLRADFSTWRLICDEQKYEVACRKWERLYQQPVGSMDGFFPPYRLKLPHQSP